MIMMSNTVELIVHEASFCSRPTVHFSRVDFIGKHCVWSEVAVGAVVVGLCEEGEKGILVTQSPDEVRRLCAEKPIPCEEGKPDET